MVVYVVILVELHWFWVVISLGVALFWRARGPCRGGSIPLDTCAIYPLGTLCDGNIVLVFLFHEWHGARGVAYLGTLENHVWSSAGINNGCSCEVCLGPPGGVQCYCLTVGLLLLSHIELFLSFIIIMPG